MKTTYILVEKSGCYECEGETDILFASEDKSVLENYNKIYNNEYEILEVPILPNDIKAYNYILVDIRIYNDFLASKNGVVVNCITVKSDTSNIGNIKKKSLNPIYTEYDNDAIISFSLALSDINDNVKDFAETIGNEIYNIRKKSPKNNNIKEVEEWLQANFNELYKNNNDSISSL